MGETCIGFLITVQNFNQNCFSLSPLTIHARIGRYIRIHIRYNYSDIYITIRTGRYIRIHIQYTE